MTAHAEDMVLVPRAELDALRAENRRLRREAGDREALRFSASPTGPGTSSKHCRSHCGTPHTGRSSTCSTNQSQGWLSRFRKATRYLTPTVSICPLMA